MMLGIIQRYRWYCAWPRDEPVYALLYYHGALRVHSVVNAFFLDKVCSEGVSVEPTAPGS